LPWANVLAALNILAFLLHTVQELLTPAYQRLREALGARQTFFNDLRALTRYMVFDENRHTAFAQLICRGLVGVKALTAAVRQAQAAAPALAKGFSPLRVGFDGARAGAFDRQVTLDGFADREHGSSISEFSL
jgi:hypothetical protein